jgi:hypothetical protein
VDDPQNPAPQEHRATVRTGSWLLLVLGLTVNVAGSLGFLPLAAGVAGGVVVAVAVAVLVRGGRAGRRFPRP